MGQYLLPVFSDQFVIGIYNNHKVQVNKGVSLKADLTNPDNVKHIFQNYRVDFVIHAAALTELDICTINKEQSLRVNYNITENIVANCLKYDSKLIYISTDAVFSGKNNIYFEYDTPDPTSVYGEHKYLSESIILKRLSDYAILRLSKVFGYSVSNILNIIVENIRNNRESFLFNNVFRKPISGLVAAKLIYALLEKGKGIYHLAGPQRLSWYEFGQLIYNCMEEDDSKNIGVPYSPQSIEERLTRPLNLNLDSTRIGKYNESIMSINAQIRAIIKFHNMSLV